MRIFKNLGSTGAEFLSAVQSVPTDPFDSLGIIIPVLAGGISFLQFIAAYVQYIVNGGYGIQMAVWREGGEGSHLFESSLTTGTVPLMYKGFAAHAAMVLLAAALVLILILFLARESTGKRLLMIVDLALLALSGAAFWLLNKLCYTDDLKLTEEQWIQIMEVMESHSLSLETLLNGAFIAAIVLILLFFLLIFFSKSRKAAKYCLFSSFVAFGLLPLFLLLLENIVSIVALIFMGLLSIGVFWFLGGVLAEGAEGSSGSAGGGGVSGKLPARKASDPRAGQKIKAGGNGKTGGKQNCEYVDRGRFEIYKVHAGTCDEVKRENRFIGGYPPTICSVADLKAGRFHLYDKATGREIKESEIPWKN